MIVKWCRGKEGWWQSWHSERHAHSTDGEKEARFSSPAHFTSQILRRRAKTKGGRDVNHNLRTTDPLWHLCLLYAAPSSRRNWAPSAALLLRSAGCRSPSTVAPVRRSLPHPAGWIRAALRTRAFAESILKEIPDSPGEKLGFLTHLLLLSVSPLSDPVFHSREE